MLATLPDDLDLSWWKIVPVSLRRYPETRVRAQKALDNAKRKSGKRLLDILKRTLYALQYNGARRFFERNQDAVGVIWNGLNGSRRAFAQGAKDAGARVLFYELSPFAGRVTVDPTGVNFENSVPRDPKAFKHSVGRQWQLIAETITQRKSAAQPQPSGSSAPERTENFIFVPLQVEGDSQLRIFGGAFKTVESFVQAICLAAQHLPKGWQVRIKEHPDHMGKQDDLIAKLSQGRVVLDNVTDTFDQVRQSKFVVTVNSSVGLESMFFKKPVVAAGHAFWAISGVAELATSAKALEALFEQPIRVGFDPETRESFLEFLVTEYYPDLSNKGATTRHVRNLIEHGPEAYSVNK
ncbi:MAG: capsular biosynthesis protein [Pseudomonadota bacterium]